MKTNQQPPVTGLITSPIWYKQRRNKNYPFLTLFLPKGTMSITDNTLSVSDTTDDIVLRQSVSSITRVQRWFPNMTIYFDDDLVLFVSFYNPGAFFSLQLWSLGWGGLTIPKNMQPFEDYFISKGLLPPHKQTPEQLATTNRRI